MLQLSAEPAHRTSPIGDLASPDAARHIRRILVFYPRRIGDWVVLTPLLRALKERFVHASVAAVGSFRSAEVLPMIPFCDSTAWIDKPQAVFKHWALYKNLTQEPWDLLIDPNPSFSRTSWLCCRRAPARLKVSFEKPSAASIFTHLAEAPKDTEPMLDRYGRLARLLGAPYHHKTELHVPHAELEAARKTMASFGFDSKPKIFIHPGNPRRESSLWPIEKFAALARRLRTEASFNLFFLAGPGERNSIERLAKDAGIARPAVVGPVSLAQAAGLMRQSDLFVSSLTGTSHVAGAVGTSTFTFHTGYTWQVWKIPGVRNGGIAGEWSDCRDIPVDTAYQGILRHIGALKS